MRDKTPILFLFLSALWVGTACGDLDPATTPHANAPQAMSSIQCRFNGSNKSQTCRVAGKKWQCTGINTCNVSVTAKENEKHVWKSTCGGYATTYMAAKTRIAPFNCGPTPPPPTTTESVKCVFGHSLSDETCTTANGKYGCTGTDACVVDVSGQDGDVIKWTSSCGTSTKTVIDGLNKYAFFNCPAPPDPTCPPLEAVCNGKCADLNTDSENCGQCGAQCPSGYQCQSGSCSDAWGCTQGLTYCGGFCRNINFDADNCGGCGTKCQTLEMCSSGKCTPLPPCAANQTRCGKKCTYLAMDSGNCGSCNAECAAGQQCTSGICTSPTP